MAAVEHITIVHSIRDKAAVSTYSANGYIAGSDSLPRVPIKNILTATARRGGRNFFATMK
jgi:hypothetical protein